MKKKINIKINLARAGKKLDTMEKAFPKLDMSNFDFNYVDKPDFLIYEHDRFQDFNYSDYDCVRITLSEEAYVPDFNICDYAISYFKISFLDRHVFLPFIANGHLRNMVEIASNKNIPRDIDLLKEKSMFCNFIYSNNSGDSIRKEIFDRVSEYKFVHSGGYWLNNIGHRIEGSPGNYEAKLNFQRECKFTIAAENLTSPGYNTEKLLHAFIANTVPIYWGDPLIEDIYNKKAFLDINDYGSMKEVVERIIEIDNNDELYMEMINEPIFNPEFDWKYYDKELESFFLNIFSQDVESAKRRLSILHSKWHELDLNKGRRIRRRRERILSYGGTMLRRMKLDSTILWTRKMVQKLNWR